MLYPIELWVRDANGWRAAANAAENLSGTFHGNRKFSEKPQKTLPPW
jgi:hypothetical protein